MADRKKINWRGPRVKVVGVLLFGSVMLVGGVLVFRLVINHGRVLGEYTVATTDNPLVATITVDESAWFTNVTSWRPDGFSVTKGYAPFPVFFQGWESTPRAELVDYNWNFGDPGAIGKNLNILTGFNSAHVFEQPGNYRVTLTVKNRQGQTAQATIDVEVLERPSTGKYYVDSINGRDTYTGKCQTYSVTDNCGPWQTAEKAFANVYVHPTGGDSSFYQYGDSVLFKRGGTYPIMTGTTTEIWIQGVLFGAYGEGAKPIIQYNGSTDSVNGAAGRVITGKAGSHDVYFQDLNFEFKNPTVSARLTGLISVADQSRGFLFLRVDAEDPRASLFRFGGPSSAAMANEAIVTGVYVIDSSVKLNYYGQDSVNDPNFGGSDMFFGYMRNMAWIGNTFDKSDGHIAYLSHLNKAVIINNVFSRPAFSRNALRIDGSLVNNKGTNNVYVADNYFLGWRDPIDSTRSDAGGAIHNGGGTRYNLELIHLGPNSGLTDQSISDVVFERNIVTNYESVMSIADADNIIIRNNLFITPNQQAVSPGSLVIGNRDWEKRPNNNITIVGNTFAIQSKSPSGALPSAAFYINPYNTSRGTTIGITQHTNIKILNNLVYRPQASSPVIAAFNYNPPATLKSQLHFDGNLYYAQTATDDKMFAYFNWSGNTVVSTTYYTFSEWQTLKDANGVGYNYDPSSQASSSLAFASLLFNSLPVFYSNNPGYPFTLDDNISQADSYKEMFKLINNATNPAIDNGVDLNNYLPSNYLPYDFSGNERPDGSLLNGTNYDIGAYEIYKNSVPKPAPCVEHWSCSAWLTCSSSSSQTRTCTDANHCGTTVTKPLESQSCVPAPSACVESWSCTSWSACAANNTQSRLCADANNCSTTNDKPSISQSCGNTSTPNASAGSGGAPPPTVTLTPSPTTETENSTTPTAPLLSGSLVKTANSPKLYLIGADRKIRYIPTYGIFLANRFLSKHIEVLSDSELSAYPTGAEVSYPVGTLFKGANSSAVFMVVDGKRQVFFNAKYFLANHYSWSNIISIPQADLDVINLAGNVKYPDGTLIKSEGANIYLLDGGVARKIASETVFNDLGLDWLNLIVVSPLELSFYMQGYDINSASEVSVLLINSLDSDQDHVYDYLERIYGTNVNSADTDHDGYNDYLEILTGHNPLSPPK
ncbi:MAG: PKD domain-containing protein [Patescibacteria group bacterium]|nr:PKD domain-containing protein [Patescibacteria group bacterium]